MFMPRLCQFSQSSGWGSCAGGMPRSTIVSMGFALNMDRSGDRVKADVLMGADGLARAIRFVQ